MSCGSAPAQGLLHNALLRPVPVENHPPTRPRAQATPTFLQLSSGKRSHRRALPRNGFLHNGNHCNLTAAAIATRLSPKRMDRAGATPRAVFAIDPASEISRKFDISHHSELQLTVVAPPSPYPSQIEIKITNSSGPLFLHWGAISGRQKEWIIPTNYPDGTRKYKNKALQTPFVRFDSSSFLELEVEHGIEGIEFLIFDEALHKWYKDDGHNFQILLPKNDKSDPVASILRSQNITPPEDLVQIQAYLRWERNGRQNYTQDQEKEEYVAAQFELEEEISRGISVEQLRAKLTNSNNSAKDTPKSEKKRLSDNATISHNSAKHIPDNLVQVQAYIKWEKAGKPNYSQEKQKMEFEETKKELQLELDNGLSVDELRRKLLEGNIQIKVSKQMENKNYVTKKRIHRKKWDVMKLLNKYSPDILDEMSVLPTKVVSSLDLFLDAKIEHDGGLVLYKKIFKLESRELLVLVTNSHGKTKVCLATDRSGPLVLHWGLSRKSREWMLPPPHVAPPNSVLLGKACETPFSKPSMGESFDFLQVQTVELEIVGSDFHGLPFVIHTDGHWMKNNGSDFYVEINTEEMKMIKEIGDGKGTAKSLLHRIAELECEAQRSFMHRFNIASDLMEKVKDGGKLGFVGMLVWMRFMATRQLVWNKNYNVKPREISKAQDRLTDLLQNAYERYPQYREIIQMILSTVGRGGEGDVGQRIRDEILVIQRNNDCKGGMMEEWHQKLHNNTSPDDVVICQALIDYINSDFDINAYWNTLISNGMTKERLLGYDRAIHSEPNFRSNQKEGLLRDLGHYMRTLKAVHSGADLESAIATCLGYSAEGEGFMVGVQINPVRGLPSGFPELLQFIVDHVEDKDVETLVEALLEAREELRRILQNPHERLKDLLFLDIALGSTVRTATERGYEKLRNASPERIMHFVTLVLENLAISSDDNDDLVYCLKGWYHALEMIQRKDDQWALFAKSFLDRTRLALSRMAEHYEQILQPSAEYLGSLLGVDQWAISIFTEEMIRAGSAAALSALLNRLDPTLRKLANLGSWQVISPNEVSGYIVIVDELLSVQNKSYKKPTILVAKSVKGEEEIPDGTVAVLTPDMPDVLSHVSVRARNCKVCFATCFDTNILNDLQQNEGKLFSLKPTSSDIVYSAIKESELSNGNSENLKGDQSLPPITLDAKKFMGKYAISSHQFTPDMVGAKSRNIAYLQGKVPSWIGVPTSVALPFGVFEKVLSNDLNKEIASKLQTLNNDLYEEEFGALGEIRENVLQLKAPSQLVEELKAKMQEAGMPWPGGEGDSRWEQAWLAIKKVWASKWNERAYFSTRKAKLDHEYLCMAVLVQEIVSADYAFVIHTVNPSSGDSSEIYAEVVRGLGETLVGAYPGRALSFVCKKNDLNSPKVLGYPSKPIGLLIRPSIIFRSDSNGEDLEGYAGAGLYDSVPMDREDEVILDYSSDPMIVDANFRNAILSSIAWTGSIIEELYGSPQDIEGVVKNGKITVVQTRPQM